MSETLHLPIWQSVREGWKAGFDGVKAMPAVMVAALFASCFVAVFHLYVIGIDIDAERTLTSVIRSMASIVIGGIIFAPAAVALHRYILSGDVTSSYLRDLKHPRVWTFALVTILLGLSYSITDIFLAWGGASAFILVPAFAVMLVLIFVGIRLSLMAPMAALDGDPFRNIAHAYEFTRGQFWAILGICVCGTLPFLIATLVLVSLRTKPGLDTVLFFTTLNFFQWLLSVALISVIFSKLVASRNPDAPV